MIRTAQTIQETYEKYRGMLSIDLVIAKDELDIESLKCPLVHSKYINYLHDEKLLFSKLLSDQKRLYTKRWNYYLGKSDPIVYKNEPLDLKILKCDVEKYIDNDDKVVKLKGLVESQKALVEWLEKIILNLNQRNWQIKNAIDFMKFTHGEL